MYFSEPRTETPAVPHELLNSASARWSSANIVLGLFSERVIDLADKWSGALTVAGQVANTR